MKFVLSNFTVTRELRLETSMLRFEEIVVEDEVEDDGIVIGEDAIREMLVGALLL